MSCSAGDGKRGPLTIAELTALWRSVTDPTYSAPFIELGEGQGFEAHTQAFAQHERVSEAVDRTTQAMYVLPFSGQTDEPASGGRRARVTLIIERSPLVDLQREVTFVAGQRVEEVEIDFGELGGVEIHTGRRYTLLETVGLGPGELGPLTVIAEAEAEGFGYNNPAPGTLRAFVQAGAGFTNDGASVAPGTSLHRLVVRPEPDVVLPEHVGQYVELLDGSNRGAVRRIAGYVEPTAGGLFPDGGQALLAPTMVLRLSAVSGSFIPGELVEQPGGASARVIFQTATHLIADRVSGSFAVATMSTGVQSGVGATFDSIDQGPELVAESRTAAWRVLEWADLGISVTNVDSPSGGRAALLDELGDERGVQRGAGVDDETYREAVSSLADVISPAAVRRAINRTLAPFGLRGWLREVGSARFRGMFYDGDSTSADPALAFAYDLNFTARPEDRFKLDLNYQEFRGFFLVGVPPLGLGDFGIAYDAGLWNAYDGAPQLTFFDGQPLTAATINRSLWQAVDTVRAGGVGFDLYAEDKDGA